LRNGAIPRTSGGCEKMIANRLAIPIIAFVALLLAGCFAEGEAFKRVPPSTTKGIVYVYRPYHLTGSANDPMVTCGHDTLAIRSGGYHAFVADPGTITCTTDAGASVSFEVRPEQEYFVRERVAMEMPADRVSLVKVGRGTGLDEIDSCVQE
jgi:hypothetical protein